MAKYHFNLCGQPNGKTTITLPDVLESGDSVTVSNVGGYSARVVTAPNDPLLTEAEFEALDTLVLFINQSSKFIKGNDWVEFVDKAHQLQSMVMSQAAARAYPDRFRLLKGEN